MIERSALVFSVDDDDAVRNSIRLLMKSLGLATKPLPTARSSSHRTIRSSRAV